MENIDILFLSNPSQTTDILINNKGFLDATGALIISPPAAIIESDNFPPSLTTTDLPPAALRALVISSVVVSPATVKTRNNLGYLVLCQK